MEIREGLTFDDVLLQPCASDILPADADLKTHFTKTIQINVPMVSAAMDTVTEAPMAIAMAQTGGIGVIHRNLSIPEQAEEVRKVKRYESGMVVNPVTIHPEASRAELKELGEKYNISGIPVIEEDGTLVGIVTNRDVRFATDPTEKVKNLMTTDLVTVKEGTSEDEARSLIHKNRIERLLVVDDNYKCVGLITVKDMDKALSHPNACKDDHGRLRVAAASTVGDAGFERCEALIEAGVDALVIDTAHGHSIKVIDQVKRIKAAGETFLYQGRSYKSYRGMGSVSAMARGSADRYFQKEVNDTMKLVPEGIEGRVAYKGPAGPILHQLIGGVRAAMGYTGSASIANLHKRAEFVRITNAGLRESHVHDVAMTREAPNYSSPT